MNRTLSTLLVSALTLATLSSSALAEPTQKPSVEQPVEAVVQTLQQRESVSAPPLVVQEEVGEVAPLTTRPAQERPRGKSRADHEAAPSGPDKPLLEIKGF